jgi:hypothetical protein
MERPCVDPTAAKVETRHAHPVDVGPIQLLAFRVPERAFANEVSCFCDTSDQIHAKLQKNNANAECGIRNNREWSVLFII